MTLTEQIKDLLDRDEPSVAEAIGAVAAFARSATPADLPSLKTLVATLDVFLIGASTAIDLALADIKRIEDHEWQTKADNELTDILNTLFNDEKYRKAFVDVPIVEAAQIAPQPVKSATKTVKPKSSK